MIEQSRSPAIRVGTQPPAQQGHGQSRDVQSRANVNIASAEPHNQRSLKRLAAAMASNEPLRDDVPRGYYLDIII